MVPVSYGYDAGTTGFYFRLPFPEGSANPRVVDPPVASVVHGRTDGGWRSGVATGRLAEVTGTEYESSAVRGLWAVDIPEVDVFDRPPEGVEFLTSGSTPTTRRPDGPEGGPLRRVVSPRTGERLGPRSHRT